MSASVHFDGWKLREAVRRTSDQVAFRGYLKALRTSPPTRRLSWQSPYMLGESAHVANNLTRERLDATTPLASQGHELESAWRNLLKTGRIVAYGRSESPTADQKLIPASAWDSLHVKSFKKGILVERTKDRTEIFDMRVFPALEAPDAIGRLAGSTLIEAFDRYVFNDPQHVQLQARATAASGEALAVSFEQRLLKAIWPINFGTASVWTTDIGIPYHHLGESTEALCRAADRVLIRRFGRLIGYLSSGELIAQGLSPAGVLTTVPRGIWQRNQTYLNLYNGDLLEDAPDDIEHASSLYRTLLIGLTLIKPETANPVLHVKPIPLDDLPRGTVKNSPNQARQTSVSSTASRTSVETECAEWLIAIINDSPEVRRLTASELWQEAKRKWPTLSKRGYDTARKVAVAATENDVWSRGGAPRKSAIRHIER
jgi:hypothetical protein